jgi:dephospho-CoA kinase
MLKIGLTGGIGSGKTTVAKVFELLGVPVYYADNASKRLYHTDKDLIAALKKHFGEDVYTGGQLERAKLAAIVFNDPEKLDLLNKLVHPLTIKDAAAWMQSQTSAYVIKEAALLFESGSAGNLDYIIGVYAPGAIRIKRVMDRDHTSISDIKKRMAMQINESVKMKLCDFVIVNDEQQMVIPQVLKIHEQLLKLSSELVS